MYGGIMFLSNFQPTEILYISERSTGQKKESIGTLIGFIYEN